MRIKQVWIPYFEWEDYINGMWGKVDNEEEMLQTAIKFTGDCKLYGEAMGVVIDSWPRTMINSLSNISINRRAFLGHCACSLAFNCPEYITRRAWGFLTPQQQYNADAIAEKHIKHWEIEHDRKNRKLHKGMGNQMLLEWNP